MFPRFCVPVIEIPRGSKVKYELDKATGEAALVVRTRGLSGRRPAAQLLGVPHILAARLWACCLCSPSPRQCLV